MSCIGSYTYNLAKFLVTILQPLCSNTYTVKDSFSFASDINGMSNVPFMCSFDISSLFTSIPLDETIGYCLDKLFTDCDTVRGLNRKQLHRLLCFSAKESHFLFDGAIYDQVDGVAMGSMFGPVLANIFMCKLEEQAITNFPGKRPIVYKRYVDDTFLVFENKADMEVFFQWINQQHSQIKFTCEKEENGTLPFLDVLVQRTTDGSLCTSIYRKPTFSGLYLRWDSFVPKTIKKGLVNGLLCRAWRLCSNYTLFHSDTQLLSWTPVSRSSLINNLLLMRYCNQSLVHLLSLFAFVYLTVVFLASNLKGRYQEPYLLFVHGFS